MRPLYRQGTAIFLAVSLAGLALSGCGKDNNSGEPELPVETQISATRDDSMTDSKTEEESRPAQESFLLSDRFREALENFSYETACSLFKEGNSNEFYSPSSLYFALAAAASGAEGETREQMLELLGYETEEKLSKECRDAFSCLYEDQDAYKLKIASSLWVSLDIDLKENFLNHVKEFYDMETFQENLGTPETCEAMSRWVSDHTGGLINPEISPDPGRILSLMNTIYYYDEWTDQFPKDATEEGIFTRADGTEVTCDFMNQTIGCQGFYKGDNYAMSSLGTKNGQVIFLLPDKGVDVYEFLESPDILKEALKETEEKEASFGKVVWRLPRLSYSGSYKMEEMLKSLGMEDAFSSENADFSSMSDSPLWIGNVSQDTHVGIDENGIEAASFTRIDYEGAAECEGQAEMILDRPFLYVVKNSGCILFVGICQEPYGKMTEPGMEGTAVEVEEPGQDPDSKPEAAQEDTTISEPGQVMILGQEPVAGEGDAEVRQGVAP